MAIYHFQVFNVSVSVEDYGFHSHGGVAHFPDCSLVAAEVATPVGVICAGVGVCVRWECIHPHLCFIFFSYKMLYAVEK